MDNNQGDHGCHTKLDIVLDHFNDLRGGGSNSVESAGVRVMRMPMPKDCATSTSSFPTRAQNQDQEQGFQSPAVP